MIDGAAYYGSVDNHCATAAAESVPLFGPTVMTLQLISSTAAAAALAADFPADLDGLGDVNAVEADAGAGFAVARSVSVADSD